VYNELSEETTIAVIAGDIPTIEVTPIRHGPSLR
jgi:hypothetical protein